MDKLFTGGREKVKYGDSYYYVTEHRKVYSCIEEDMEFDIKMFDLGNYYADYAEATEVSDSKLTREQQEALPKEENEPDDFDPTRQMNIF